MPATSRGLSTRASPVTHCLSVGTGCVSEQTCQSSHAVEPGGWPCNLCASTKSHHTRALSQDRTEKDHFLKLQMAADSLQGSCDNPRGLPRGSVRGLKDRGGAEERLLRTHCWPCLLPKPPQTWERIHSFHPLGRGLKAHWLKPGGVDQRTTP